MGLILFHFHIDKYDFVSTYEMHSGYDHCLFSRETKNKSVWKIIENDYNTPNKRSKRYRSFHEPRLSFNLSVSLSVQSKLLFLSFN